MRTNSKLSERCSKKETAEHLFRVQKLKNIHTSYYEIKNILPMDEAKSKVAIIGSGMIGRSWAMLFAAADYKVCMYDKEPKQLADAVREIEIQLKHLEKLDLLRGHLTIRQQMANIVTTEKIADCVNDAIYIQECVPERLEMKRAVYEEIDSLLRDDVILASSASALLPSVLAEKIKHKNRYIVAHPSNPPFHMPLVELVPSPWTDKDAVLKAETILEETGQVPVVLKKEIAGYANNRIQCAMFSEIWRLVRDDIITIEDLEKVMSSGLGRQYAFIGPIEALYLGSAGMHNSSVHYGEEIERIQRTMTGNMRFSGRILDKIQAEMETWIPLDKLAERRQRRDRRLAALSQLIKKCDADDQFTDQSTFKK